MSKSTERFTLLAQDYIKYRPHYPKEIVKLLVKECGLNKNTIIADVGSGTGILAKLFLDNGNKVYGVEPNQAMREVAENYLKDYRQFHSLSGTAEATTLADQCIDLITVGTAFHWFDAIKTKHEFRRILKVGGWVVLVWNVRDVEQSALVANYEKLILNYSTDYKTSQAHAFDKTAVKEFFSPNEMKIQTFPNVQYFDWPGLKGRLLSASYSLRPGDHHYEKMIAELKEIFERHQKNGLVEFLYQTKVYYSKFCS